MDHKERIRKSKKLFPLLEKLIDGYTGTVYVDEYYKSKPWIRFTTGIQTDIGRFGKDFYRGIGYVLAKRGVPVNTVCKAFGLYSSQVEGTRLNSVIMNRGLIHCGEEFKIFTGEGFELLRDILKHKLTIMGKESALRLCYYFSLYGVAWYKSFPLGVEERINKAGGCGIDIMNKVEEVYGKLESIERGIVDLYVEMWRGG